MNDVDKGLLKVIIEDIEYISQELNTDSVSDATLRRLSTILRRFLIERNLFQVADFFGATLQVRITDQKIPLSADSTYYAGGATNNGVIVMNVVTHNRVLTLDEIKRDYEESKKIEEGMISLREFLQQPGIVVEGVKVNRERLIQYVSNKLGGSHYDPIRESNKKGDSYRLLDQQKDSMELAEKNVIYFEILNICQKLVSSPSVQEIKVKIKDYLSK